MKADAAALIVNETISNPDPLTVAQVLAAAIRKLGSFDLVMVGREAGDWGAGQTAALLAEELSLPCVSFVDRIEAAGGELRLKRQTDSGGEIVAAQTPLVISITNDEHNVPRIPKVRDVMMSYRQPLTQWTLADLGIQTSGNSYYEVVELGIPEKETRCEFVGVELGCVGVVSVHEDDARLYCAAEYLHCPTRAARSVAKTHRFREDRKLWC